MALLARLENATSSTEPDVLQAALPGRSRTALLAEQHDEWLTIGKRYFTQGPS
jgi:hypothetical protein